MNEEKKKPVLPSGKAIKKVEESVSDNKETVQIEKVEEEAVDVASLFDESLKDFDEAKFKKEQDIKAKKEKKKARINKIKKSLPIAIPSVAIIITCIIIGTSVISSNTNKIKGVNSGDSGVDSEKNQSMERDDSTENNSNSWEINSVELSEEEQYKGEAEAFYSSDNTGISKDKFIETYVNYRMNDISASDAYNSLIDLSSDKDISSVDDVKQSTSDNSLDGNSSGVVSSEKSENSDSSIDFSDSESSIGVTGTVDAETAEKFRQGITD